MKYVFGDLLDEKAFTLSELVINPANISPKKQYIVMGSFYDAKCFSTLKNLENYLVVLLQIKKILGEFKGSELFLKKKNHHRNTQELKKFSK